ncbi:hypothetical protein Ciccas_006607 [Cichlidogyrus casuarinus]|uniref:Uncharacterized protein n=1 Tax=Cichlidogyrus casuarinus TaxID=1844966 RepID=A0ABD2Q6I1_9PLAT
MYKALDYPSELDEPLSYGNSQADFRFPSGILMMIHEQGTYPIHTESDLIDEYTMMDLRVAEKQHFDMERLFPKEAKGEHVAAAKMPCIDNAKEYFYYNQLLNTKQKFSGRAQDCIHEIIRNITRDIAKCIPFILGIPITEEEKYLPACSKDPGKELEEAYNNISSEEVKQKIQKCYRLVVHSDFKVSAILGKKFF